MKKTKLFLILTMLAMVLTSMGCQKNEEKSDTKIAAESNAENSADNSTENVVKDGTEKYYMVSFGLNDAETNTQKVSTEDASKAIRKIITDKGLGYTEYNTYGAYTEDGKSVENVTLVYFLVYVEDSDVENIVNEAKKELNLKSVLIQESTDRFELIEGSN